MKKINFNVFEKVKQILGFGFLLLLFAFIYITLKEKPSLILFIFLMTLVLIFFLNEIFGKNYYCGNEIIDTPYLFKKRIRNFSQISSIQKGYKRIVYISFSLDTSKKEWYSGVTRIEYTFQKEMLIEMLKKISESNPDVKFVDDKKILSLEEFIQIL